MILIKESLSTYAADIDQMVLIVTVLVGFWFILAEGIFFWLIIKYRAKDGQKAEYITGEEKHSGPHRIIQWSHWLIIACDIVILVFAIRIWYNVKQVLPDAEQNIRVTAQQWSWIFQHPGADKTLDTPDDITTINELHVQTGTQYTFELLSRDVLHDFSIPVFRLKQDILPGRLIRGWFETKEKSAGVFDLQCAEMCGIGHGIMAAKVFIEEPEDHLAWMQKNHQSFAAATAE